MSESLTVFKVVLCVPDYDRLGRDEVVRQLQNVRFPNRCIIGLSVEAIDARTIENYTDDHPFNYSDKRSAEFATMFEREEVLRERAESTAKHLATVMRDGAVARDVIDTIVETLRRGGFVE